MPATCQQAEERRLDSVGLEVERADVPLEVIDGNEWQLLRPRESLRGGEADEQGPDQARPLCHRDGVELVQPDTGFAQGLADDRQHQLEMAPRRDLWDDATEARMQLGLRRDDIGVDPTTGIDDGRGRLVARGFECEDQSSGSLIGSFHMISASSRLSV